MKNWKTKKTDYWATAITMMASVMVAIACIDIATAWFGIEKVASVLGIF